MSYLGTATMDCEIIVVDNNSDDETANVVSKYGIFKYLHEFNIGLSVARNAGAKKANGKWLVYLDDDCYISKSFFCELEKTILKYNFDAFTGNYLPWFRSNKPKWLPESFGAKNIHAKEIMEIEDPDFFTGGIMALKKSVLSDNGLFPTSLGMSGDKISYGEETFIEEKLKANHYCLGINPKWIIFHLVREEKLKLRWHFRHKYAQARDDYRIRGSENLFKLIFKPFYVLMRNFVPKTKDLIFKKGYYWQNYLLDLGEYFAFNSGRLVGRFLYPKLS